MKLAVRGGLSGSPKPTLPAPTDMFTPSPSRMSRIVWNVMRPNSWLAPIGMQRGSMITSSFGMPWSAARSTIFLAILKRSCGSLLIPVSSLAMPMTAAPYFFTRGRSRSSTSSSPVTEFTSAFPL
jgi:hypothetical protein